MYFLKKTYLTIIKQPLSFSYSIQATMNRIILNNECKDLNVEGINDDIFVDGNTLFAKVTYFEDFKEYNYLGFHYDYIYGINAKSFRIKELNLYHLDDYEYYSSLLRKYITLQFSLLNNIKMNLNHFLCIAKRIHRIAILPKILNENNKPHYRSYVDTINIMILEKKYGKDFREPLFFKNFKVPSIDNNNKKIISGENVSLFDLYFINERLLILSNWSFSALICTGEDYIIYDSKWQKNNKFYKMNSTSNH